MIPKSRQLATAVQLQPVQSSPVSSLFAVLWTGLLNSKEPGVLADEVVLPDLDFSCLDLDELPPELEGLEDEDGWLLVEWEILSLRSQ